MDCDRHVDPVRYRFPDRVRYASLNGHGIRMVDRYFDRIIYGFGDWVRHVLHYGHAHGVRPVHRHLDGIRRALNDFVRNAFYRSHGVRYRHVYRVRFVDVRVSGNLHFARNVFVDGTRFRDAGV